MVRGLWLAVYFYLQVNSSLLHTLQYATNSTIHAWMVELVDTRDLKSREPCARASSILALGTSR